MSRRVWPIELRILGKDWYTLWAPGDGTMGPEFMGAAETLFAFPDHRVLQQNIEVCDDPHFGDQSSWTECVLPSSMEPSDDHCFDLDSLPELFNYVDDRTILAEIADTVAILTDLANRFSLRTAIALLSKVPSFEVFLSLVTNDAIDLREIDLRPAQVIIVKKWPGTLKELSRCVESPPRDRRQRYAVRRQERTIPRLYPGYFIDKIRAAGLDPDSASTVRYAVTLGTERIMTEAVLPLLEQIGYERLQEEFLDQFYPRTLDERNLSLNEICTRPDRMIDWLWEAEPRFHDPLAERISAITTDNWPGR